MKQRQCGWGRQGKGRIQQDNLGFKGRGGSLWGSVNEEEFESFKCTEELSEDHSYVNNTITQQLSHNVLTASSMLNINFAGNHLITKSGL